MAAADLDVLLREVDDVKHQLARHSGVDVDNNLIFESLEHNGFRRNRVEFVVKQFLGQDELDEFGIPEYDGDKHVAAVNRGDETIDLTVDPDLVENSSFLDASGSVSKELVAVTSDVITVDSESYSSDSSVEVLTKDFSNARGKRKGKTVGKPKRRRKIQHKPEKRRKIQHTNDSEFEAIPSEPLQNASISNTDHICDLYDVNNNDPNNNFEPDSTVQLVDALPAQENIVEPVFSIPGTSKESSVPSCSFQASSTAGVSYKSMLEEQQSDDDGDIMLFNAEDLPELNQESIREELLREARFIHNLVPHHHLDEIFSYLEANLDCEDRMNVVLLNFLQRDKQRNDNQQEGQLSLSPTFPESSSKETSKNTDVEPVFSSYSPDIEILSTTENEQHDNKMQMDVTNPESEAYTDGFSKIKLDFTPQALNAVLNLTNETSKIDEQNEVVQKHITTLTEMFPNLPKDFIEQHIRKAAVKDVSLERLVFQLLEMDSESEVKVIPPEENLARSPDTSSAVENSSSVASVNFNPSTSAVKGISSEEQGEEEEEVEELRYKTLLAIFPDADPDFLRQKADSLPQDDDSFRDFITTNLEQKGYPTRKDYELRQERAAMKKKYSEEFSVQTFLEAFPDPLNYFKERKGFNDERIRTYGFNYLKNTFCWIRMLTVKSVYHKHNYNLTKAFEELQSIQKTRKRSGKGRKEFRLSSRQVTEYANPEELDVPFLQEIVFLNHKDEIDAYLKEKAERRQKAFEEAKAKGELLECGCCYDNEVLSEDMRTCEEGHMFCKECVRRSAEIAIGDGKTSFPCLLNCKSEFSLKVLQSVLKPEIFSKMLKRKQLEEVKQAGIEGLETCPFCDFAGIPEEGNKIFSCLNPECMKESCRLCRQPNHIPLRCEEVEKADEIKMRVYIEDRMTQALVRECWKCKQKFVKEDGCNKMRCHCGALMCYICRKPVKDYTHFNGQGGTDYHKCPLYSNNDDLHVKAVEQEALKAKKEVEEQNPDLKLKHDPTKILPSKSYRYANRDLHHQRMINALEYVLNHHGVRHRRRRRYAGHGMVLARPFEVMPPLRLGEHFHRWHTAIMNLGANIAQALPVQPARNAQVHNARVNRTANYARPVTPNVQVRTVSLKLPGQVGGIVLPDAAPAYAQPDPARRPRPAHQNMQTREYIQPVKVMQVPPAHQNVRTLEYIQPVKVTQVPPAHQNVQTHEYIQPVKVTQIPPAHQNVQTREYIQPEVPPAHQKVQTRERIQPVKVTQVPPAHQNVQTREYIQPEVPPAHQKVQTRERIQPVKVTQIPPAHQNVQTREYIQPEVPPAHQNVQTREYIQPVKLTQVPPAHQNVQVREYVQSGPVRRAPHAHQIEQTTQRIPPASVRQALPSQTNVVHGTFGFVEPGSSTQIPPWSEGLVDTVGQTNHRREAPAGKENDMFDSFGF